MENITLCGPPGVGKTTVGRAQARKLDRPFVDTDEWIVARHGRPIANYFTAGDEALFRAREAEACRTLATHRGQVIAVGGGALLDPHSRAMLEATGPVILLRAERGTLWKRLASSAERPLIAPGNGDADAGKAKLAALLDARAGHYASFPLAVDCDERAVEEVAESVERAAAGEAGNVRFLVTGHQAVYGQGLLGRLGEWLSKAGLHPPFLVITDANVARLHGQRAASLLGARLLTFPAGEENKTLDTVRQLYDACLSAEMERGGTIVAVGGGVVGDVAGFVAATLMRGIRWASLPTTVLAMADAALGGKTGVDLPEGKNLVGAFHPPALVLADFNALQTLPDAERRCGLVEVLKAGVIGDPGLFEGLSAGTMELIEAIRRAAGVKVGIVNADPLDHGERAQLNYGHTLGHGLESATGYRLAHGEAVGLGMIGEAWMAEHLGLAKAGMAKVVREAVETLGLPSRAHVPSLESVRRAMSGDKKKSGGKLRFALPVRVGKVQEGIEAPEEVINEALLEVTEAE